MLSFIDTTRGCNRRDFLRVGSLALGGLMLPHLLAARQARAEGQKGLTTGKSVIFLFQHGGPSQIETFDPKMDAPEGIRSATGATPTSIPGVTFGGTMTQLARHAHRLAIVRSFQSESGNHNIRPIVGPESLNANLGSLYARVVGTNRPGTGMPTNAAIFPNAVDPQGPGASDRFGKFAATGGLGVSYAPFIPGAGGLLQENMQLRLPRERLEDRRSLLAELDRVKRQLDADGSMQALDEFHSQAFDVITGGIADAFDLSKEDPNTLRRYDTSFLVRAKQWEYKNNKNNYTANAGSLGKLLLLARRLCEAGCGFVTINTAFVWDMHADKNNLGVVEGMDFVGNPYDHAVSAFIEDVEARGLSDQILLVTTGEMGRTPKINKNGGRDHWGKLTPLLLYGGGVTDGQIIGQSSRDGGEPASTPMTNKNLIATIMNTLFDVGELRVARGIPADLMRVITEHPPITGLG
ncbi:MAG: DUF1501 domain-containing protein [Gemmataceae bacterium]